MISNRKLYAVEFAVIVLLWTLAVISPLFFISDMDHEWRSVHVMWMECAVVGVAFLINRIVLMPRLFFRKRYIAYIISIVGLLLLFSIFILHFDGVNALLSLFGEGDANPPIAGFAHDMSPQHSQHGGFPPPPMSIPPTVNVIPPTISVIIASLLVLALDLGLRIAVTWIITEQKQSAIDGERITAQLQNLQSQVSPHFFMNTLNNIHALVDIDSQRAKGTIIELSDLMSYLLYDSSNKDRVLLQRELDFINSYINLMRLRFSTQVKVNFSYNTPVPSVKIPPLLFLNFIENAFKYGVDCDKESIVKIKFDLSPTQIVMTALNSNHSSSSKSEKHGLGVENSRKRLDLLYGSSYTLDICEMEKIYYVTLKIPIQ